MTEEEKIALTDLRDGKWHNEQSHHARLSWPLVERRFLLSMPPIPQIRKLDLNQKAESYEMTQTTEQKIRTRAEQAEALSADFFDDGSDEEGAFDMALGHILEAEARGAEEQRRKDAEISRAELFCRDQKDASDRTPERADVVQWQKDQNEFFMSNVLEIVTEYAAWRDRKDAEGREPIGYLSMTGLEQLASALHGYANLRRLPASDDFILKWGPDIPLYNRPANVAALEARVKELEAVLRRIADSELFCGSQTLRHTARAALKREGGV